MRHSRRTLLKALIGLGLCMVLVSGVAHANRRALYRRYLQLSLDDSSAQGILSPEEFQVISAAYEVVSPKPAPRPRLCASLSTGERRQPEASMWNIDAPSPS
jgi:hypothetical protein